MKKQWNNECNPLQDIRDLREKWGLVNEIEIIARFLEDFTIKLDKDHEIAPSLKRLPKGYDTWKGFIHDAQKLCEVLDMLKESTFIIPIRIDATKIKNFEDITDEFRKQIMKAFRIPKELLGDKDAK